MEIIFEKEYLSELYFEGETSDKQHRFQPKIIAKYKKTIDLMESLASVEDFYRYHSLNYERLKGDKRGMESGLTTCIALSFAVRKEEWIF